MERQKTRGGKGRRTCCKLFELIPVSRTVSRRVGNMLYQCKQHDTPQGQEPQQDLILLTHTPTVHSQVES